MEKGSSPSFRRRPESSDLKDGIGCPYNYRLIGKKPFHLYEPILTSPCAPSIGLFCFEKSELHKSTFDISLA